MRYTAAEAAGVWNVAAREDFELDGASIDSRGVRPGSLFVALPGKRADGHDFVADALARGARAALVSRAPGGLPPGAALFHVPDVLAAFQQLAAHLRRRAGFRLAAVTGSAGKTTTKEMLAAILAGRLRAGKTPGNLNSEIGFPLAIANLDEPLDAVAGEMGMSHAGELSRLSRLFRPDAVAVTNVAFAHAENFPSAAAIADAKWEILEGLAPDGLLVYNADDPLLRERAERYAGRAVAFGFSGSAQVRARDLRPAGLAGTQFELELPGQRPRRVRLPVPGRHQVANALAAAALAGEFGIGGEEVAQRLEAFELPERRGRIYALAGGAVLVDDSYNSSPSAARAALESLSACRPAGRRIAVLGDMLELGAQGPPLHREVGRFAASCADRLVCVGPLAAAICDGAVEAGLPEAAVTRLDKSAQVAPLLSGEIREGDVIWVKGSRGVRLDVAADALRS